MKFAQTLVVSGASSSVSSLCSVAEGSSINERYGKEIFLDKLESVGQVNLVASSTTATVPPSATVLRGFLILDRQANSALPAVTDIFLSSTYPILNPFFADRFSVIDSFQLNIDPPMSFQFDSTTGFYTWLAQSQHCEFFDAHFEGLPVRFANTSGTSWAGNNLLFVHTLNGTNYGANYSLSMQFQLSYSD